MNSLSWFSQLLPTDIQSPFDLTAINGGNVLLVVIVWATYFAFPPHVKKYLHSPILAKSTLIGVIGCVVYLMNHRPTPLAVSLVAALLVASTHVPTVAQYISTNINYIYKPRITRPMSVSSAVLIIGAVAYLLTLGIPYTWTYIAAHLTETKGDTKFALFTLPVANNSVGGALLSEFQDLDWTLYRSIQTTFNEAFSHMPNAALFLPEEIVKLNSYGNLREQFTEYEYDDELLFETYRDNGLPTEHDQIYLHRSLYDVGKREISYSYQLMKLDDPPINNGRIQWDTIFTRNIRILRKLSEVRRATLLAGTSITEALITHVGLPKEDEAHIFTRLLERFRDHYRSDPVTNDRSDSWEGHTAFNEHCEKPATCVKIWKNAYAAPANASMANSFRVTLQTEITGTELVIDALERWESEDL